MAKVAVILVVIFIVLNLPRLAIGVFEVKVLLGPKNGPLFSASQESLICFSDFVSNFKKASIF